MHNIHNYAYITNMTIEYNFKIWQKLYFAKYKNNRASEHSFDPYTDCLLSVPTTRATT